ncbi:hypothetical protein NKH45_21225 [Mesorhizobium sp. M1156]|uniref:hypothetical protein n=1 Tax=unclassified Mesorhizobium TaxID=325217 RepID=UPI00333D164B
MSSERSTDDISTRASANDDSIRCDPLAGTIEPEICDFRGRVRRSDARNGVALQVPEGALRVAVNRLDGEIGGEPIERCGRHFKQFGVLCLQRQPDPRPQLLRDGSN